MERGINMFLVEFSGVDCVMVRIVVIRWWDISSITSKTKTI